MKRRMKRRGAKDGRRSGAGCLNGLTGLEVGRSAQPPLMAEVTKTGLAAQVKREPKSAIRETEHRFIAKGWNARSTKSSARLEALWPGGGAGLLQRQLSLSEVNRLLAFVQVHRLVTRQ